ncbi:transmembrane protein 65-like [Dreissena polymorpha]|uniref:Transmembrane protein 65 n=1 Tax=Dreissena polymorpha TaxID=45954 RepID=A0A9D3YFB1_DREPO|nr:transmembrane protein 65-like [Dreissena polymorpha]KAH3698976.1 hypothetical protein DPMN_073922 [Dreissena polymorpha]
MALRLIRPGFSLIQLINREGQLKSFTCLEHVRVSHQFPKGEVEPSKYKAVYRDFHGGIDGPSTARDFVYALNKQERDLLHTELMKLNVDMKDVPGAGAQGRPSNVQLKAVMLHNAVPFIGFGFLDNFLMLIAGDYIEHHFGAMFAISTMAAAALGNWISDLAGIQMAHHIESVSSRWGVKTPAMTAEQVDMRITRLAAFTGKIVGITIGCFLGMCPLLFI